MNETDLIVEQLLEITEEVSTGIFMKQLDNGRRVYTCKCPVCGTLHGGFRTYAEAEANKKCREHRRKEVEKTRKEIEKVDEPKKPKDLFKNKNAPKREVKVNEIAQENLDIEAIVTGSDFKPGEVNRLVCENVRPGQSFWHRSMKYADGSPIRVEVSGPCITWEDRPNEFSLPVKYGRFQTVYITESCASEYTTDEPDNGERELRPNHPGGRRYTQEQSGSRAAFATGLE